MGTERDNVEAMTDISTAPTGSRLAMFPLSTVLFPYAQIPLHVFEPRYRALVADCLAGDARFGIVLPDPVLLEVPTHGS